MAPTDLTQFTFATLQEVLSPHFGRLDMTSLDQTAPITKADCGLSVHLRNCLQVLTDILPP